MQTVTCYLRFLEGVFAVEKVADSAQWSESLVHGSPERICAFFRVRLR